MRCALYKADTNGNLLLKFKSYSSYISNSPTAVFLLSEGKAAPGGGKLARQWVPYVAHGVTVSDGAVPQVLGVISPIFL